MYDRSADDDLDVRSAWGSRDYESTGWLWMATFELFCRTVARQVRALGLW